MKPVKTLLALIPVSLFAVGCSSGHKGEPAPVTPGVQITTANAMEVATLAIEAAFGLASVGDVGSGLLAVTLPGSLRHVDLKSMVQRRVGEAIASQVLLAASTSETLPGPGGGQVIRTFEDRDGDEEISTGDSFLSSYTGYGDQDVVLSGVVTIDQMVVTGRPLEGQTWTITARMAFVGLEVTSGADATTLNGSLRFTSERRTTVDVLTLDLDQGLTVGTLELQPGNKIGYNVYPIDFGFALLAEGSVKAEGVSGLIHYETKVPFTGLIFVPFPWAGELEVRGAGNSRITVRMVDFTSTIEIEIDADGDGEVDEMSTADWTTL